MSQRADLNKANLAELQKYIDYQQREGGSGVIISVYLLDHIEKLLEEDPNLGNILFSYRYIANWAETEKGQSINPDFQTKVEQATMGGILELLRREDVVYVGTKESTYE
jgi:hypothetical protein